MKTLTIKQQTRVVNKRRAGKHKTPVGRIPRKMIQHFTRDLAIMLKARMLLTDSIEILAEQNQHQGLTQLLGIIERRLKAGASLAECLRSYPGIFDGFYVNLVAVGEITGRLDEMLGRISRYLEKMADLRRKLIQAMTYPSLVIGVAVVAVGFILLYVIPTFADIFSDFDAELPLPTRIVIAGSEWLQQWLPFLTAGLAAMVLFFIKMRHHPRLQPKIDYLILHIPLIGAMIHRNYISQFCRTLGTLLDSGISLLEALEISSKATGNYHIRQEILAMQRFASKGEQLTRSLKSSQLFPLMVTRMIEVGEETAELPFMLTRIADFYDQEIDNMIDTLSSVIEPLVIIILGITIGAILISIYLPLFNMAEIMPG